ncbi:hypothetical protein DWQ65_04185 [Treponema phagedenis]|uniref:Uncharacterized protein n=1 Tax=Treponema phagedenis TaxID=162 RepID=A0A0B7GX86_TREPH|nr:hypothetical protein [Treponema phagedenis]QEJ98115.1 hypothetical protein FUT82_08965 [Treponema phagedenis]QEK00956.1 hypothetical protein FUT84_07195 [Treponema phagedenis]QEK03623.1 hypothetical protein FUT83_07270 [Treponema phagedenis]QEK05965.1 hypothetical protein FUT80_04090 [Treponema phagedenis]
MVNCPRQSGGKLLTLCPMVSLLTLAKLVGEPKVAIPRVRPCSIPNDVLKHQHKTAKLKL